MLAETKQGFINREVKEINNLLTVCYNLTTFTKNIFYQINFMSIFNIAFFAACVFIDANAMAQQSTAADSLRDESIIFTRAEVEAGFTGGVTEWRNFLQQNLNVDVPGDNGAPAGKYTVIIQFIVGRDGSVKQIVALTNLGYGLEAEVIRIIQKSGKWTPAYQNGRAVNAYRKQPVTFVVESDEYSVTTAVPYKLFANVDNEITVTAREIKPEHISASINIGSITPNGNGKFIVRISKPGRVIISVSNTNQFGIQMTCLDLIHHLPTSLLNPSGGSRLNARASYQLKATWR